MDRRALRWIAPCLALTLPACSAAVADGEGDSNATSPGTASLPDSGDSSPGDEGGEVGGEAGDSASASAGEAEAGDEGAAEASAGEAEAGESDGMMVEPGQLTAGEWRDLDHWDYWRMLLQNEMWAPMEDMWGFFTQERYAVVVTAGAEGPHVADAEVALVAGQQTLWSTRTDVHGEAELFAGMFQTPPDGATTIEVTVDGVRTVVEGVQPAWQEPIHVVVEAAEPPAQVLDLMFMIDTTGSMADELSYLQVELADVIDRVRTNVGQDFTVRLSVNFYRDEGDEYLVKPFAFTTDIDQAITDLGDQRAAGGGDIPEAVEQALKNVVEEHDWSASAVARLCFLVLDAPPHDTPEILADVRASVKAAAARGIRLIPLAASGTDKPLEFLMRFGAIGTGGTYTFLTDHSGIGGAHVEPTVGAYQIEYLNDLLARLISDALVDG